MIENKKIAVLGSGNMARALSLGLKGKTDITIINPADEETAKTFAGDNGFSFGQPCDLPKKDIVILAFKPQNLGEAKEIYGKFFTKNQTVISILAGIKICMLEDFVGEGVAVVRTMPNLALQVSKSATAFSLGKNADETDAKLAEEIFSQLGVVTKVKEDDLDTVTALSGSGPAYIYLLAECMTKAAVTLGMTEEAAAMLTRQTFLGTIKLWKNSDETPTELRKRITSKKGTTEAAVNTMLDCGIEEVIEKGLAAAKNRSAELAKEMQK